MNNAGIQHNWMFNRVDLVHGDSLSSPDDNAKKTRSGVVMVSSLVVHMSCCTIKGIYGATKAFDDGFARGVAYEWNMSKMEKGLDITSAQDCASAGLNELEFALFF